MGQDTKQSLSVSISPKLLSAIDSHCAKTREPRSSYICRVVDADLQHHGALRPCPVDQARAELEATIEAGVPVDAVRETLAGLRARQLTAPAVAGAEG